jgi:hypothetical protein
VEVKTNNYFRKIVWDTVEYRWETWAYYSYFENILYRYSCVALYLKRKMQPTFSHE